MDFLKDLYIYIIFYIKDPGGGEGGILTCAGCLNAIDDDEFVQALNQEWHIDCFR